mgnify:CR=1 FL=1
MGSDVVIATAGHVDHGKSSLIRALTGIDPDRLPEEKIRGLTIDIGFGHIISGGNTISFVDLPGHENYVKNMIAGVTGADGAILCIDINEGVMPQTIEHTNILKIIGIKEIVVAITKSAGVDESKKDEFKKKVLSFLKNYTFDSVRVLFTDIFQPETVQQLKRYIVEFAQRFSSDKEKLPFMMRVDRVFSKKGFGVVVTGTTIFGKISKGETVEIFPNNEIAKVKNINVHGKSTDFAKAHQRTALNLASVSTGTLERGAVVAKQGYYKAFKVFLGEVSLFDNIQHTSLKSGKLHHVYIGTDHMDVRINLLGKKNIKNGEKCFCKIRFENSSGYPGFPGDIFLLRGGSPLTTVGGGKLITPDLGFNSKITLEILESFQESTESAFNKIFKFSSYLKIGSRSQYFSMDLEQILKEMNVLRFGDLITKQEIFFDWVAGIKSAIEVSGSVNLSKIIPLELLKKEQFFNYFKEHFLSIFPKDSFQITNFELSKKGTSGFELLGRNVLKQMENDISLSNAFVISKEIGVPEKEVEKCMKFLENREMIKRLDAKNYITTLKYKKFIEDAKELAMKDGYVSVSNIRKIINAPRKIIMP